MNQRLCAVSDLAPGEKLRVISGGRTIVVCRSQSGEFFAVSDNCPHQGASLCAGALEGTTVPSPPGEYRWGREGEILRCPWHAWEFDIRTGQSLVGDRSTRVATYDVSVSGDDVVMTRTRRRQQSAPAQG